MANVHAASLTNTTNLLWVIGDNGDTRLGIFDGIESKEKITSITNWSEHHPDLRLETVHLTENSMLFIDEQDEFWTLGCNEDGECGIESAGRRIKTPTKLTYFHDNNISIERVFTCVNGQRTFWLTSDHTLYCNGYNNHNQLGTNYDKPKTSLPQIVPSPADITSGANIIDIKPGNRFSLALVQTNHKQTILCIIAHWSRMTNTHIPAELAQFIQLFTVSTSVYITVKEIFSNSPSAETDEQDEQKTSDVDEGVSVSVSKPQHTIWYKMREFDENAVHITKIDVAGHHCLCLDSSGNVWSFGYFYDGGNGYGQLGLGHFEKTQLKQAQCIPYFRRNGIRIKDICCGWMHSLALDVNGRVYAWGYDKDGQCASGQQDSYTHTIWGHEVHVDEPVMVDELKQVEIVEIQCGIHHSLVRSKQGKYWLFGSNTSRECITGETERVLKPICINELMKKQMTEYYYNRIKHIRLGNRYTVIVTGS